MAVLLGGGGGKLSANYEAARSVGVLSPPRSLLYDTSKWVKLTSLPSLGSSPAKNSEMSANAKPLNTGAEQFTVEAAVGHLELLEVRESAPFRRNSTSELVRVANPAAGIEHLE